MLTPRQILGPDGRLASRLAGYQPREQQMTMADAVVSALRDQQHLMVEAGTGTGKSFGYLVPAILHATESQQWDRSQRKASTAGPHTSDSDQAADGAPSRQRRVVISTHTISLQEQLMTKDLPLLNSVIPREFSAVLVKGRGNYLSLRRMNNAIQRARNLFQSPEHFEQLATLRDWVGDTPDGSLSDLSFQPSPALWDEVQSDSGNCMGRNCEMYDRCFYYRARRRSRNAQILVVNHALFFSDLALREFDASILPDYDAVVFDEAHTLEAVASDHLGLRLTNGQIDYNLRRLFNDRTNKGLLVDGHGSYRRAQEQVDHCREAADHFFVDLHYWFESQATGFNGRAERPHVIDNHLSDPLRELAAQVKRIGNSQQEESKRKDFGSASDRLSTLADLLDTWLGQNLPDTVYWVEQSFDRQGLPRHKLAAAPLEVGDVLRRQLFQRVPSVIMTSATLATGNQDFGFFQSRVGVVRCKTLQVGSPFDYARQSRLIVVRDMPDPTEQRELFERQVAAMIERYAVRTEGRAFALFTSYDLLRRVASRIIPTLRREGLDLLSQADGMPRSRMLERFKQHPRTLLLGTDSFWQGVDVAGDGLQNIMITKLPFSVPDQPLRQARMEAIKRAGGNAFFDLMLPEAIIKFRQGFGRLIRTTADTGIVVVLDPRIVSKRYGKRFLAALPSCPVEYASIVNDG